MDTSLRQQVREPNAFIGGRIRAARGLRGWSQERLGAELGVTFQQVQKYEKGANRVSACTLARIAALLDLDLGFFFPAGASPVGRAEIEMIRKDIDAGLTAIDTTIAALAGLRDSLTVAAGRLSVATPSQS